MLRWWRSWRRGEGSQGGRVWQPIGAPASMAMLRNLCKNVSLIFFMLDHVESGKICGLMNFSCQHILSSPIEQRQKL